MVCICGWWCAGKVYKPRNYLVKEFPELQSLVSDDRAMSDAPHHGASDST